MTDEVRLVAMRRHRAPNGAPYYMPVRVEPTPGQEHAWDAAWQDAITEEEAKSLEYGDGLRGRLVSLHRAKTKLRAAFNPEGEAMRDRQRQLEHQRNYRKRHPDRNAAQNRDWARRNREKQRAHSTVRDAVRDGKLVRPEACEDCKSLTEILHAHHDDYAKRLEVRWLCPNCHAAAHSGEQG